MAHKSFKEIQRFNQPWLWIFLLFISLGLIYLSISSLYTQIYLDRPWGDHPLPDNMLWLFAILMLVMGSGLPLFFAMFRLETKINEEGVHYLLRPFQRHYRLIRWSDISRAYVRKYKPILEYGGWGIRYGRGGKAINVSGNTGIQLELINKKKLLIGTRQPAKAGEVIKYYLEEK